jgi:hypothetical protein
MRPAALLPIVLGLLHCSHGSLRGGVYTDERLSFRIGEVPSTWQRLETDGASLAFRDDQKETSVLLNARCGRADEDVPLPALTRQLFMTFTEREVLEQKTIPMDGREALHTLMRAKLDGVPKVFDVYVLKKDGCVYDFVAVSAPGTFSAIQPLFDRFVAGFHTPAEGN